MGGNVFKTSKGEPLNRRYSKEEYKEIIKELKSILRYVSIQWTFQKPLEDKETFGDLDLVIVPNQEWSVDKLKQTFSTEYVHHNGTTWSVLYKDFQVDLITTNLKEYEFCVNYFCQPADRCNFVGKIAHMLGLKFGHDGLWLPVRSSDSHKLGDVLLTLDPHKAEEFLDIKPLENATCFQDVFDNIVASKYFNPEVFLLENNNAIARVRDKKRPSYHQFLDLCKTLPEREYFPRSKDKSQYLQLIFNAFPHAHKEYRILFARKEKADKLREIFNGKLVSEWTGLTDKPLGEFMVKFKRFYTDDMLLDIGAEKIETCVKAFHANN